MLLHKSQSQAEAAAIALMASVMSGRSSASVVSMQSSKGYCMGGNQPHGVNTANISEVNGYTFGACFFSGDDDGTTRHNRDHELLAVDAALLLGEVKGQHTIEAELRFVLLREGTLDVPNLKLYDQMGGKWYNCVHLLKIVVAAKVGEYVDGVTSWWMILQNREELAA
eukprot:15253752-Ditylum_brightwellii.AAC.1